MSGHVIPVVPKRVLDFGGVALGTVQSIVLADRVELVNWQELSMTVRVHQHSLAGGTGWISISAVPCSVTEDDPGTTFLASAACGPAVLLDASTGSPDLKTRFMRTMGPNCVGDMVRIVASAQRLAAGTLTATISVELSAKDGTSFMPTRISNCILWLHADDYNPSDGTWPDRSGAEHHGLAPTGNHPTLETNFNGLSDLLFDGVSQYVAVNGVAPFLSGDDKPFTAIYLFELLTLPPLAYCVWGAGRTSSVTPGIDSQILTSGPTIHRQWRRDDAGLNKVAAGSNALAINTKYSIAEAFSGKLLDATVNLVSDVVGFDLDEGQITLDQMYVGALPNGGVPLEFGKFKLREFSLFSAKLSSADIASVVNGMHERAGLASV